MIPIIKYRQNQGNKIITRQKQPTLLCLNMARLTIIKQDNPLIRKTSKPVDDFSPHLHELLDNMYETLLHANGMGLAAVQVGVLYRMAIILTEEYGLIEIINPIIKTAKNNASTAKVVYPVPASAAVSAVRIWLP